MSIREFLLETFAYLPPPRVLEQLTPEQATARPRADMHSIAEIVGPMHFWQMWFLKRCRGIEEPMVTSAVTGWPAVTAGDWERLRDAFMATLTEAAALGDDPSRLSARLDPPIDFPPLAEYTMRDALIHMATHNAHHFGQIVTIRQLQGAWPPPAGSFTW